jgi:hypothetical protein
MQIFIAVKQKGKIAKKTLQKGDRPLFSYNYITQKGDRPLSSKNYFFK